MTRMKLQFICAILVEMVAGQVQGAAPITAAALAWDANVVVLGSQTGLEVRSVPELTVLKSLPTDLVNIHDLAFSPDGHTLLAAGGSPAESGVVEVFDWPAGSRARQLKCHDDVVYRVAWSPDGTEWATASGDGQCQTFEAKSGERRMRYKEHSRTVLGIAYLGDGKSLTSVGVDQTLRLWESTSARHLRTLDNHVATVNAVAVRSGSVGDSPPVVATIGEDRTIRLWQPTVGRLMRFARLPSIPRTLAWSAKGGHLCVGCNDGRVRILDFDALDVVKVHDGNVGRIHELLVVPASSRILIAGESGIQVIEQALP